MKLSVVIIGYNSWHYLEKNLASLAFLAKDPEAEILFVDNASSDGTIPHIEAQYPSIQLIRNTDNKGVSFARNQGIRQARGQYIWLLDSDTEVREEALTTMLRFMDNHPEAGICGCKMYGQDGQPQQSCRRFPALGSKLKAGLHILGKRLGLNLFPNIALEDAYDMEQATPFVVDYVIGACQLIRREAQQQVGLLDEKIFYGPEDADFCLRMHRAGYKVYYLPNVSIYHAYQRASYARVFSFITRKHIAGLAYYFWKHRAGK